MSEKIVVLGATGYVGTRLVTKLLQAGKQVRATSRTLGKLKGRHWSKDPNVELVEADVLDEKSLARALDGCAVAYYLVHSMNKQTRDFADADKKAAENMIHVAEEAKVSQIIYLGGLGDDSPSLSKHLKSRFEVGKVLQSGKVPVTSLHAAMIIGSGSASFEILRYLVERLPIMITPKWVSIPTQPIGIANVLTYLEGCLGREETFNRSFDVGGPDVLTYRELMEIYADEAGLEKRIIIPIPLFTPRLSSYWIHLVTPVPAYLGRPLAEGLKNITVCRNNDIQDIVKQDLLPCRAAVRKALDKMQYHKVESHWTDAGKIWPVAWSSQTDEKWAGGSTFEDKRSIVLNNTPEEIWQPLVRIGGDTGYYYGDWLWRLRGVMDKMIGGVGLRRGRRSPDELSLGDALDFWRVKDIVKNEALLLVAEMILPGEAVLEFRVKELEPGKCELTQTAKFLPKGLLGLMYWYAVTPLHDLVFDGMLLGIAQAANRNSCNNPLEKLTVARAHK
jgi:uncharacterized protein YbjT (DUF2867 family)